jgi:hypothetical protein
MLTNVNIIDRLHGCPSVKICAKDLHHVPLPKESKCDSAAATGNGQRLVHKALKDETRNYELNHLAGCIG